MVDLSSKYRRQLEVLHHLENTTPVPQRQSSIFPLNLASFIIEKKKRRHTHQRKVFSSRNRGLKVFRVKCLRKEAYEPKNPPTKCTLTFNGVPAGKPFVYGV